MDAVTATQGGLRELTYYTTTTMVKIFHIRKRFMVETCKLGHQILENLNLPNIRKDTRKTSESKFSNRNNQFTEQ